MRIAFAHYSSADDISGVTSWLIQLALYLKGEGCNVAIVLLDLCEPGDTSPLELALRQGGIEIFKSPPTGSLRQDVNATLAFLNAWRPDVFLPQCKPHHYIAAAIAGRCGLPWGLTLHSDDPDYWATASSLPPLNNGGKTICVSKHIQAQLAQQGGESQAVVIPYGVSIPATTTHYSAQSFQVIYSGRLWEHQKRASLVVESLIRACQRSEAINATLIGDGYSRQACEQQVLDAGLADRISFSGRLPFAGVQKILLQSQAILLMSDFEGLPVALLEAMAAGVVPVVRSIPSGIPEVVRQGDTGLLVSDDPDEAAAALGALADNPGLWQSCSAASRQLVEERFSSDHCHGLWLALVRQLQATTKPIYPITGLHGVRFSKLSPLLKAGYRHRRPWETPQLRQRLSTRLAKIKGLVRQQLKPQASTKL
jgi:colanic acid/amylovoran biosynthesis glycosyltransferase